MRPQPVLADAGYGNNTEFRQGRANRQLHYVVGVESNTVVWDKPTQRVQPRRGVGRGRPRRPYYQGQPQALRDLATTLLAERWRSVTWRQGSRGAQRSRFAACRVQPAHGHLHDRPKLEPVWLLIEWPAEPPEQKSRNYSMRVSRLARRRWLSHRTEWRVTSGWAQTTVWPLRRAAF